MSSRGDQGPFVLLQAQPLRGSSNPCGVPMTTHLPCLSCLSSGPWAPLICCLALLLQDAALPERPLPLVGCTVEAHVKCEEPVLQDRVLYERA